MRTYKTEGIILKRTNFGEADRILTIFTKRFGKIKARAPGIRKTLSKKAAHLELFNLSTIFLVQGKNMDIVTEVQTLNNFSNMKKDLHNVGIAYYFCELVSSLCPERQENKEVFELLKTSLEEVNRCVIARSGAMKQSQEIASLPLVARNDDFAGHFANHLLWLLGYLPKTRTLEGGQLENFIENILERKLKSKNIFGR